MSVHNQLELPSSSHVELAHFNLSKGTALLKGTFHNMSVSTIIQLWCQLSTSLVYIIPANFQFTERILIFNCFVISKLLVYRTSPQIHHTSSKVHRCTWNGSICYTRLHVIPFDSLLLHVTIYGTEHYTIVQATVDVCS